MRKAARSNIKNRLFIVGCPRSGTTLLQSLLASHSQIASFPESHFFRYLYPENEPRRKLFRIASRCTKSQFFGFLESINASQLKSKIKPWTLFQFQYINCFSRMLDQLAEEQNKSIWLEKTPDHLQYLEQIEGSIKDSKFIHIVRNGFDVVASLYEVTQKYPKIWHGPWSIDQCIRHWVKAIEISKVHIGKRNHTLVHYDRLSEQTEVVLRELCDFSNIEFESDMLSRSNLKIESLALKNEPWKAQVSHEIVASRRAKYNSIFSETQKMYISEKLAIESQKDLFTELVST